MEDQFQHIILIRGSGFWKSTDHLKINHNPARTSNARLSFSSQQHQNESRDGWYSWTLFQCGQCKHLEKHQIPTQIHMHTGMDVHTHAHTNPEQTVRKKQGNWMPLML